MSFWKPGSIAPGVALDRPSSNTSHNDGPQHMFMYNHSAHLSMAKQRQMLPVRAHRNEILFAVEHFRTVIIVGQTGSGKSTQVPQYLDEARWTAGGRQVVCCQPRRLAAATLAARVAQESNVDLGTTVGYSIPFDNQTSTDSLSATRLKFTTDGVLLKEMMSDPLLLRYSVVIVDEAHERSVSTDLLLGLLRKIQRKRLDLRVIVQSATINAELFQRFFETNSTQDQTKDTSVTVGIEGVVYPVDVQYCRSPVQNYVETAIKCVLEIHATEQSGDILIFMTSKNEIEHACSVVRERVSSLSQRQKNLRALPLYAGLPKHDQMKVFEFDRHHRKAIFSTNIAETSITISGVSYVIDCGFVKRSAFDATSGMEWLSNTPVSQANANQRAGRAGRLRSGKCFRLYTDTMFNKLPKHSVPEIQRCNLCSAILQLKALGIDNIINFDFLPPAPSASALSCALEQLFALGALDDYAKLTEIGSTLAELSVPPSVGKALLAAVDLGCGEDIIEIAAMLSVTQVWKKPRNRSFAADAERAHQRFAVAEGDLLSLLNVWRAFDANGRDSAWCAEHFLDERALHRAANTRKQLRAAVKSLRLPIVSASDDPITIQKAIVSGFFSNAAKLQRDGTYRSVRGQRALYLHPSSVLVHEAPTWLVFYDVHLTDKHYMRDVTRIEARWLTELAPHFYEKHTQSV